LIGKRVDEDVDFKVLLRDTKGYCYEGKDQEVKAKIEGPFMTPDLNNNSKYDTRT